MIMIYPQHMKHNRKRRAQLSKTTVQPTSESGCRRKSQYCLSLETQAQLGGEAGFSEAPCMQPHPRP